jgi:oxygen-independent coproporphyrinogen-3 oxidase
MARTVEIVALARRLGFGGINFDLVYGLPLQTAQRFAETIAKVVDLRPDRLALYNFAYLPGRMANQRAIDAATLPPPEEKLRIFLTARERLEDAGYRSIGLDHFALPGDELARAYDAGTMRRNFMGLTTRGGDDMVALGATAIGYHDSLYVQNAKKLASHARGVDAGRFPVERGLLLGRDDLVRRDVIERLMCSDRVDMRAVERRHGIVFGDYFAAELERLAPMAEDGLLAIDSDAIRLTPLGRLLARNVAMAFDAYLKRPGGKKIFSRTV